MADGDIREVEIFGGAKGPYGDAVRNPRRPGSYKGTMHMSVEEGQMVPFFKGTEVFRLPQPTPNWNRPIEWVDANGFPIVFLFGDQLGGTDASIINPDGTITIDAFTSATKRMREEVGDLVAVLHSDGSTLPYLFAAFGTSGTIEFRTQAGVWAEITGTPLEGNGLYSENGNLWVVLTNGYQVRKWPAGVNPTSGTALAAIDIGNNNWEITGAGLLGRSYIVFVKPDGVYIYDIDHHRFENLWTGLAQNPHPDTGKGTYTWGSNVYVPLGWGGLIEVTRDLNINAVSLLPDDASADFSVPGRSLARGMAGSASHLYVTVEPFTRRIGAEIGISVLTTKDDVAFNDRTAVATDSDPTTNFTFADLSPYTENSIIYVGTDVRFHAPWFLIESPDNAGVFAVFLEYWDGDSWELITYHDYTELFSVAGPVLPVAPVPSDWATATVGGVADKYWLRCRRIGVAEPPTTTEIREVRVIPEVAALPGGSNVSTSGMDEADCFTHIFRGTPTGRGFEWDDVGAQFGNWNRGLLFSRVLAAGSGKSLLAVGTRGYVSFPVGFSDRPQEELYPSVQNSFASLYRAPGDDRISNTESAPTTQKGIEYIDVYGKNFDGDNDEVQAWVSFDGGTPQYYGRGRRLPTRLQLPRHDAARGYEYSITVALYDGVRDAQPLRGTRVVAGVYPLEGPPDKV